LGKLNFQQGTEDGVPGIGHVVRAIANINFSPSEYEPCGLTHLEGFACAQMTVATNLGGFADLICEDKQDPFFNGFLFPRFPQWNSKEQDHAIQETLGSAIEYWNQLSREDKNSLMHNLIEISKRYSWTTSPKGLSPIEKYEKVISASFQAKEKRGAKGKINPLLLQAHSLI
jgi:glycogen synthase